MNKKELAQLEDLKKQVRVAKALRFTSKVEPDIRINDCILRKGWLYNDYNGTVDVACSDTVFHAYGRTDKTNSQGSRNLYSTRLRALKAVRYQMELKYAEHLAEIDAEIESEHMKGILRGEK